MRAIKFGPELQLTALQGAQRGIRMNTPPAPNLATPATLCVSEWHPWGPRRTWLHLYNALLEDHCEKEAQSMEGRGRLSKVSSSEGLREGGGGPSVIWESLLFFWRPREREECLWAELLRQLLTFTHNKNTESYFCKLSSYSLLITLKL